MDTLSYLELCMICKWITVAQSLGINFTYNYNNNYYNGYFDVLPP